MTTRSLALGSYEKFQPGLRDEKRPEILGKRSGAKFEKQSKPSTPGYLILGLFTRNRLRGCLGLCGFILVR